MAYPTSVNNQITDAVSQTDVAVVGGSPAISMGSSYQSMAHALGLIFTNSVAAQQNQNTLATAAANMGVLQMYSLDTVATAGSSSKAGTIGSTDQLAQMLATLRSFQSEG